MCSVIGMCVFTVTGVCVSLPGSGSVVATLCLISVSWLVLHSSNPVMFFYAANFTLPEEGQLFDSVLLVEEETMSKEEAAKWVDNVRNDARKQLPPPEKRLKDSRFGECWTNCRLFITPSCYCSD